MPRRYNDAIYKDSVGALLQQHSSASIAGHHSRRRRSGGAGAGAAAVKNYRLDNRANIKEIQAQNRQRREEEAAPVAEPFKLRQFKNVKSRFASAAAVPAAAAAVAVPPVASGAAQGAASGASQERGTPGSSARAALARDFLRKGTREKLATELRQEALRRRQEGGMAKTAAVTATGSRLFGSTTPSPPSNPSSAPGTYTATAASGYGGGGGGDGDGGRASLSRPENSSRGAGYAADRCGGGGVATRKEAVPRAGDVAHLAPRSGRNFVAANRMQASGAGASAVDMKARDVSDQDTAFTHENYGRVPEYLVSRQEQWEKEADRRRAEEPDPSCPPGMKVMPEGERLQTLRQLQENESVCQSQLNTFPLVVQTPLLQRRVDELNKKLKEIDEAKAIFSRARV
ncbi:unnamed protein product, partial [Pylaiella littoralis]